MENRNNTRVFEDYLQYKLWCAQIRIWHRVLVSCDTKKIYVSW